MAIFVRLFLEFFKTGLFAVGGGLATIPFLYELSEKTGWFTKSELTRMIAISESTPGPLGVNMSTYVGFSSGGVFGAVLASLALVCPSIIIITIVSKFLTKFRNSKYVEAVFHTLRPASAGLIVGACWGIFQITMLHMDKVSAGGNILSWLNYKAIILAAILFVLMKYTNKHPALYIGISAVIGILLSF